MEELLEESTNRSTSLYIAAEYDSLDAFVYILSRGIEVGGSDYYGYRPIHNAAVNGAMSVLRYILDTYPDETTATDARGDSALECAAIGDCVSAILLLLERGADYRRLSDPLINLNTRSKPWLEDAWEELDLDTCSKQDVIDVLSGG